MSRFLKKINSVLFSRFYNEYPILLETEIAGDAESLLDVGCGDSSKMAKIASMMKFSVGIDNFEPRLQQGSEAKIYSEYRKMNILEIGDHFGPGSFDCVMASDVIEHLKKEDGFRLLEMMERIARKKIIIFTPNGFLEQQAYDGNPLQIHLSGWDVDEMEKLGFRVIGVNGLKFLRGERTKIRWQPERLWFYISLLTQPFVRRAPRWAFQMLCIKEINGYKDTKQ